MNGFYRNHFTVFAEVVAVHLQLSTDRLDIESAAGLPPDSSESFYAVVTASHLHQGGYVFTPVSVRLSVVWPVSVVVREFIREHVSCFVICMTV